MNHDATILHLSLGNLTLVPCSIRMKKWPRWSTSYAGTFRAQVILMRSSEAVTALHHSFKTLHMKGTGRYLRSRMAGDQITQYCDMLHPEMLVPEINRNQSHVCRAKTFQEQAIFCEKPRGAVARGCSEYLRFMITGAKGSRQ